MNSRKVVDVALLMFSLAVVIGSCTGDYPPKVTVTIHNSLEGGRVLGVQCPSADDNLPPQLVRPDESWSFSFRENTWATTLFHCSFKWPGEEHHKFRVYGDTIFCKECNWYIQPSGGLLNGDLYPFDD
ncbi:hypothetical protein MLD38_035754 [Melastoma candidum]|uniref:Uncharacterized protein n=1 Tax=Melastoma candidum TaxID=119954 RepID=A0ACB9LJD6_9MYRT|nr:hypothetical protein MLD38_035754 [Melastoma candidum]